MEKTLSLGAFEEPSENEVMVMEGGFGGLLGVCIYEAIKTAQAKANAQRTYDNCRNELIRTINTNPIGASSIPQSTIEYFNIQGATGGYKGVKGGAY